MFIREIKKHIKKDGKYYDYVQHRLVESVRTPNGPRQRIVLNLGTLDVEPSKLKTLANMIESLAYNDGQQEMFPDDPELQTIARHFAQVLIHKRVQIDFQPAEEVSLEYDAQYESVDLNSAITTNGRSIGAEHIALSQLKEIGFFEILEECGFTKSQQDYAAAQVCGRLVHPSSERETARWLRETSGFEELLGIDLSKISDHTLHHIADQLYEAKDNLEEQLSQTTTDLFSLDNKLVLYDLTNTYFESPKRASEIAAYGKSKERRSDCPLVTLALVVDEHGFPKRSQIFKGNVSEPQTLWQILPLLDAQDSNNKPQTVIIDAGIATEENLAQLREDDRFEYVAVHRSKVDTKALFDKAPSRTLNISRGKTLDVKIVRQEDETFVLCQSEDRAVKEKAMFERRKTNFEQELRQLKKGLDKPRTVKNYDKIIERIGRIKERHKVGHLYTVTVDRQENEATNIKWRFHKEKARKPGQYILRTSHTDLSDEQISSLHRTLTMIESSFRWLKSDLGLRPNFHQYDHRVEAHIFISVLAFFALAPILNKLSWGGKHISTSELKEEKQQWLIPYGWRSVVYAMATQSRVTTTFRCKNKKIIDIRTTLEPTANQLEIYHRLNVPPRPLKNVVMVN
jgi:hypothetical protein